MIKLTLVLSLLLLCACAPNITTNPSLTVPESIQPYAQAFEDRFGGKIVGVAFIMDDLPYPVLGRCTLPQETIEIDQTYWATASDAQKEETVSHELGHCVLFRAHLNTLNADGNPTSMMNAYLLNQTVYSDNRDYYLSELFELSGAPMLFNAGVVENTTYDN